MSELSDRIKKAELPKDVQKVAEKELRRLKRIQPQQPEHTVVRNYLDWLLDLPWSRSTEDRFEIARVREQLDLDHYGLEKVKRRILEYIAVRSLTRNLRGPILCLVGPPGELVCVTVVGSMWVNGRVNLDRWAQSGSLRTRNGQLWYSGIHFLS